MVGTRFPEILATESSIRAISGDAHEVFVFPFSLSVC
ncbi:MAG: hypothetical protein CM1200mP2_42250 [Planctomycetaceae bacterium]|nr:MAG: hypothetical protein CM1200mP2_42250 [Planctomycetaceae bacterium]